MLAKKNGAPVKHLSQSALREMGRKKDRQKRKSRKAADQERVSVRKTNMAAREGQTTLLSMLTRLPAPPPPPGEPGAGGSPVASLAAPADRDDSIDSATEEDNRQTIAEDVETAQPSPSPPPTSTDQPRTTHAPVPVAAHVDDDDSMEQSHARIGVMNSYLCAVQRQLKKEASSRGDKSSTSDWLLPHLKEEGYWLRQHKAKFVCDKLGLDYVAHRTIKNC